MANLNDLPLNDEEIPVDVENVQQFGGGSSPVPQPGRYVMELPSAEAIFNAFEIEETADQGQRLRCIFKGPASWKNVTTGQYYDARISNKVRAVTLKDKATGEESVTFISEMAQLLNVVGSIPEGKTNTAYGNALVNAGGRRFMIEHTITASCGADRDVYKDGKVVPGRKGCGQKYATEAYKPRNGGAPVLAIPKDENGKFSIRFECSCGAELRCWSQIRSFAKVAG